MKLPLHPRFAYQETRQRSFRRWAWHGQSSQAAHEASGKRPFDPGVMRVAVRSHYKGDEGFHSYILNPAPYTLFDQAPWIISPSTLSGELCTCWVYVGSSKNPNIDFPGVPEKEVGAGNPNSTPKALCPQALNLEPAVQCAYHSIAKRPH